MKQKKMYIRPEIQVVEIEACSILADSGEDAIGPGGYSVAGYSDGGSLGNYDCELDDF